MSTLIITRGLPASGKTTWARDWVAGDPDHRVRLNRDDYRVMLHGRRLGTRAQEDMVTVVQHAAIVAALRGGLDVVVDDTNLAVDVVARLQQLAIRSGARFEVADQFLVVPTATCISRDRQRPRAQRVGEDVITGMVAAHTGLLSGGSRRAER